MALIVRTDLSRPEPSEIRQNLRLFCRWLGLHHDQIRELIRAYEAEPPHRWAREMFAVSVINRHRRDRGWFSFGNTQEAEQHLGSVRHIADQLLARHPCRYRFTGEEP